MDKEESASKRYRKRRRDPFSQYRKRRNPKNLLKNPRTYSTLSTNKARKVLPGVRRNYKANLTERYSVDDLADNSSSGSLWASGGQDNFLFSKNKTKKNGDIVILQVMGKLKNEITAELKRSFPSRPKKKKKKSKDGKAGAKAETAAAAAEPKETAGADPSKVYDKVSSVIVEEVNKDYLLIRGTKEVLYKRRKHLIEIQSLVNQKDIGDDDTVASNRAIERSIQVLR